jgi:signal transduction histidine kinase
MVMIGENTFIAQCASAAGMNQRIDLEGESPNGNHPGGRGRRARGALTVDDVDGLDRLARPLAVEPRDLLLGAALTVAAQADLHFGGTEPDSNGFQGVTESRPVVGVALAFMSLALIWRRSHPLAVLSVVAAAGLAAPLELLSVLAILLLTMFSIAVELRFRPALAAWAVTTAVVGSLDPDDLIFASIVLGSTWLAGRAVRRYRALAEELRHERDRNAKLAVADERARIAREVHDVLAHTVSVMVVQAEAADVFLEQQPDRAREALASIGRTGRSALSELRRLLGFLRDADPTENSLAPQPSLARIEELVDHYRAAGLPVELSVTGQPRDLPPGLDLSAYRIIQEALTNTLKHAGPAHARVTIGYTTTGLDLDITDDGTPDPRTAAATSG